jgi:DNA-binding winged helix-turn-helix (wHTH) protein
VTTLPPTAPVPPLRCRFGGFELDEAACELRDGGAPVRLQPKELALLVHLVRHRGRAVTYDELRGAIWSGGRVGLTSVHRAVSRVRSVLRRGIFAEPAIRTHARLGYRFVAPVEEGQDLAGDGAPPTVARVAVVAAQFVAGKRLAPQTWMAALQAARIVSTAIVTRFGGTTTTTTGHGVLAHFAGAGAADAALRAAWALVEAVKGTTLAIRIGIHADAATVIRRDGEHARDVVVGEAPAGALRVRECARPSWIVVSDAHFRELTVTVRTMPLPRRGGSPVRRVLAVGRSGSEEASKMRVRNR